MSCQYHSPTTVLDAVRLRAELGAGAVFLAGGTDVNSAVSGLRPAHLISLAALGLGGIEAGPREVTIGACVRIQELLDSADVPEGLRLAAARIGNRNIRNAGTIGGHLGANKSWGDLLPALLVLGARVVVASSGGRAEVTVDEIIAGHHPGLITHVRIPAMAPGRGVAIGSHARTANDVSVVNVAVALERGGDRIVNAAVAAGGVAATAVRLGWVEQALSGQRVPETEALEAIVAERLHPPGDVRGSVAFKRHVAAVLVGRAVRDAWAAAAPAEEGR